MKSRKPIIKTLVNTAIGMAAGILAIAAPAAEALADDNIPVIDMGTFENSFESTDSWIKDGWEYEKKDDYIVLKRYTGNHKKLEIPGKINISGKTYKVKISNETFNKNNILEEIDFKAVDGQKVTVYGELNRAFAEDNQLQTLDLTGFDTTGVSDYRDILYTSIDTRITLKGASEDFINEVVPLLKDQNRYLGTVKVTAKVTLTGKTLSAEQFSFRLYKDSVSEDNLIKRTKNTENGSIDFGAIKVRDVTKPLKLIAVQEEAEGYNNKTGDLSVTKTIRLKSDGTISIVEE